jgi:hypothetical protein
MQKKIKERIRENITVLKMYACNNIVSKYRKQNCSEPANILCI